MSGAADRDQGVLDRVQPIIELLNHLFVHVDELTALAHVERLIVDVVEHAVTHLMPQALSVQAAHLVDFGLESREFSLMVVEDGGRLSGSKSSHDFA